MYLHVRTGTVVLRVCFLPGKARPETFIFAVGSATSSVAVDPSSYNIIKRSGESYVAETWPRALPSDCLVHTFALVAWHTPAHV